MGQFGIGQPVRRFEDKRLLTGFGRFQHDLGLAGQVHGYVLRSPHAHARIRKIDLATAKAAPGVLAIYTGEDLAAAGLGTMGVLLQRKRPDGSPMFWRAHRGLAEGRVRYVGEPVAFVVAETAAEARDAAELIEIDYEILPSVTDTAEAADGKNPGLGRMPGQHLEPVRDRRQGRDRGRFRRRGACRQAPLRDQPGLRAFHGAARRARCLGPGRGPLHPLRRRAVPAPRASGAGDAHLQNPRKPHPRHRRRCRRRVRHQGLAISGAPARAVRREAAAPSGALGCAIAARRCSPTSTRATMSATPSWPRMRTAGSWRCGSGRWPMSARTSRPSATCSRLSAMSAR